MESFSMPGLPYVDSIDGKDVRMSFELIME